MTDIWTRSVKPGEYIKLDGDDLYIASALAQFEQKHNYKRSDYKITNVTKTEDGFKISIRPYCEITEFTIDIEVE